MKRKLIFLFFLIGITGSIIGLIKFFSSKTPKQGVLKVNSQPVAGIYLDDKHIGKTPYEDKFADGEYTIRLVPESSVTSVVPWQGRINVKQNLLTYINADLSDSEFTSAIDVLWLEKVSSRNSEIAVTTDPDGATITLDGETKGVSPLALSNILGGDHTLLLSSPGFLSRQLKVKTHVGYKLVATLKLALSTGAVDTSPIASPSVEPIVTLPATISATVRTSPTVTQKITPSISISPNQQTSVPEKPYIIILDTPTGFLRVRSQPTTKNSEEIGRVKPGEKYHVLKFDESNWYEINFSGTSSGWVSGQYAQKVD